MHPSFRSLSLIGALLGSGVFAACQKAQVEPDSQNSLIVGRWELTQTTGGIGGGTRPADPAQRREIEFAANGQAQVLLNGTPTTTAAYTLSQRVAYLTQRPETFLNFPAPATGSSPFIAELSATTLALSQDGNDGITATYRREQPLFCGTR